MLDGANMAKCLFDPLTWSTMEATFDEQQGKTKGIWASDKVLQVAWDLQTVSQPHLPICELLVVSTSSQQMTNHLSPPAHRAALVSHGSVSSYPHARHGRCRLVY